MRKILIATHASYAAGIREAAEMILGPQKDMETICAYIGNRSLKEQLEAYFSTCKPEDTVVVLTDLYGGSVNQVCMEYMNRPNTHLLTGINLALLLQIVTMKDTMEDEEMFQQAIEEAREQISYVNASVKEIVTDDFNI